MDWVSTDEFLRLRVQKQRSSNHGVHGGTRGQEAVKELVFASRFVEDLPSRWFVRGGVLARE
jgi:hypothetical protein